MSYMEQFNFWVEDSYFDEEIFEYPDKTIRLIALNCKKLGDNYEVLEHEKITIKH